MKKTQKQIEKELEILANTPLNEVTNICKKQLKKKNIISPDLSQMKSKRICRNTIIFSKSKDLLNRTEQKIKNNAL